MTDYKTFEYNKNDAIAIINFRNDVKDKEWPELLRYEVSEISIIINEDDEVRLAVLSNIGNNGFLINLEENDFSTESGNGPLHSVAEAIAKIEKPVIAEIGGEVLDSAMEMILAADIRIASDNSGFCMTQIKKGGIPGDGGTQRLPRLVGKGKALEMILTGLWMDADEALRTGLVNRVVPFSGLNKTVMDIAVDIAAKSPISLRYAKEAINAGMDMTLEQGVRLEADLYMLMHTSLDRTEGISAFQEKRKPRFEGK